MSCSVEGCQKSTEEPGSYNIFEKDLCGVHSRAWLASGERCRYDEMALELTPSHNRLRAALGDFLMRMAREMLNGVR